MSRYEYLFLPIKVGPIALKDRIVRGPPKYLQTNHAADFSGTPRFIRNTIEK
jgi:2,4-dienoyl-CoA reductase-like NADH-dependent reductase (Old Yellow Enzyme family)